MTDRYESVRENVGLETGWDCKAPGKRREENKRKWRVDWRRDGREEWK